ncbi:MAG: 8-oxo-dGTP diphosphatase [Lentisphaerae bacterium]|jgi:8-oxo-dGTP diphosphatase|nr:8-oxo-dGTP diphosphatase [Lentisphaerota bacterium]MBT4815738.1 8-oxo-dGTP diphosphatase [Lentisphaerota bacterium]MBT5610672.1 8-oxo-dGTP diphosphatase [Lentisphaerota bacterium]MBT7058028.1 8-oxo-dGTP diphosphatase [Lentisphaerota bacterium]MBT7840650.1 8-oxo-dGTP diphosphatase [Lentisphaerota bacterium]
MADYCPIASTLGYVLSPDGRDVLMVHRVNRVDDEHQGKYNGLGGHLEADEDVATGIIREIREEAGIECTALTLRGTINWNEFGPDKRDWLGFIFLITAFEGVPFEANEDGPLEWVSVGRLPNLPMWEGDRFFLPLVFDGDARPFHGHMRYNGEKPTGWTYVRM